LEGFFAPLVAPVIADLAFQCDLPPDQPGAAAAQPAVLPDLGGHPPELVEGAGKLGIVGWPHRPQQQMAGSAALGPLEHAGALTASEGNALPGGRGLGAVAGRVGTKVDRSEAGAMLVEEPHRRADRDLRAAAVSVGAAHQSLAVPGAGAHQNGPVAAPLAGEL